MFMPFFIKGYEEDYSYDTANNKEDSKFCHSYSPLSTNIAITNMIAENALPIIKTHDGMFWVVTNFPITIAPNVSLHISPVIFEIFSLCLLVSFTTKVYLLKTLKSREVGGSDGKEN